MTLSHGYGVAVGSFVEFTRDPAEEYGHWYHGHLVIATPSGHYRAALDVDKPGGGISYRIVDDLRSHDLGPVAGLAPGFHVLAATPTSGALDYVRSPVLRDGFVVRWVRIWFKLWYASWLDRILGRLHPVARWIPRLRWRSFPWLPSSGDHTLNVLEALLPTATRIYIFGEPFTTGLGVHNVHQNQGDPPGPHQVENGIWQDGAVAVRTAGDHVTIWQVKFNTQSLRTGDDGLPLP
ncbi:DUF2278 family protein [Nocardioides daphniae]|nr:DUF2278 family protein [Nocardioides daphniae]GGD29005.1 hypothetical protein GCM10007231_30610 [Nocardioides daphniae]